MAIAKTEENSIKFPPTNVRYEGKREGIDWQIFGWDKPKNREQEDKDVR